MDTKGKTKKQQKIKVVKKAAKKVVVNPSSVAPLRNQALSVGSQLALISETEVFEMAARMVLAMLDPGSVSSDKLTLPFLTETVHLVFPKVVRAVRSATSDGPGRFSCITRPTVFGSVHMTDTSVGPPQVYLGRRAFLGNQYTNVYGVVPPGRYEEDTPFSCFVAQANVATTLPQFYFSAPGDSAICPSQWDPVPSSVGGYSQWAYYFGLVFDNTVVSDTVVGITCNQAYDQASTVTNTAYVWWSQLVAGVWTAQTPILGSLVRGPGYSDSFVTNLTLTGSAGTRCRLDKIQFGWSFSLPNVTVLNVSRLVQLTNANNISSDHLMYLFESDLAPQIEDIGERSVCLASTMWFHWFGSTLENGGSIVGYRMPKNYPILSLSGTVDDRYERLNSIPRSYLGAAKDGSYGFWVPSDRIDLDPFSIHDTRPNSAELALAARIDDPTQNMTMEVRSIILVTTVAQLFSPTFLQGCNRATELAMLMLSQVPCFTCNPTHMQKIQKAMSHIWTHRDKVMSGASTALKAAKVLAPVLASALL